MTSKPISTGSECIDSLLNGGISAETINLIYGEPETGKTTMAMQCASNCALQNNLKTFYVDCDNTFSPERLSQITKLNFNQVADQIILIRPKDFAEQAAVVDNLQIYTQKNFGLVIIDTINGLYRAELAEVATKAKQQFSLSRELNRQMAVIAQIAKTQRLPVIITSQVKALINEPYISVAPVATRVVQFWANTTIALKLAENPQSIQATIKSNQNPKEVTCYLRIAQTGIHDE